MPESNILLFNKDTDYILWRLLLEFLTVKNANILLWPILGGFRKSYSFLNKNQYCLKFSSGHFDMPDSFVGVLVPISRPIL